MGETTKSRVLVVDDDLEILEMAKRYFVEIHNHDLITADGFDSAVKAIHDTHGEMVAFVDIHLKGVKSGFDVLTYIQENAPHRVVAYGFTAEDSLDIEAKALRSGAINVFHKSIDKWDRLVVYAEQSLVQRLLRRGFEDNLTGLYNFDWFKRTVKAEMKASKTRQDEKHPKVFTLLFIDLDNLRWINNTYGHLTGDRAIHATAEILRCHVRPNDHLCRKGGDEFLIWMPDLYGHHANEVALKLMKYVSERLIKTEVGLEVPLSISIGSAQLDREDISKDFDCDLDRDLETLISNANRAEMKAKERRKIALTRRTKL